MEGIEKDRIIWEFYQSPLGSYNRLSLPGWGFLCVPSSHNSEMYQRNGEPFPSGERTHSCLGSECSTQVSLSLSFQLMLTCSLLFLSMKTTFLVAITSAWRVWGIGALKAVQHFTVFFKDKVLLCLYLKFMNKVSSEFHISQVIHLSVFSPKPH